MKRSSSFGNISRQFTESERAIDDRLTSHLTAPPIQMRIGDSIGQSYKWLKEDLSLRSTLSDQLAQEQQLAYSQSARHELADQAVRQDEEDALALDGFKRASELTKQGGIGWNDAVAQVTSETPNLALSKRWQDMSAEGGKYFRTQDEIDIENMKRESEILGLGTSNFDKELAWRFINENPDLADRRLDLMGKTFMAQEASASNSLLGSQIQEMEQLRQIKDIKDKEAMWSSGISDDPAAAGDQLAAFYNTFEAAGLSGIESPEAVVRNFGQVPALRDMLGNSRWIMKTLPDQAQRDELVQSINIMTSNDQTYSASDKAKARANLFKVAGRHSAELQQAKQTEKDVAALNDVTKGVGSSYSDISDDINGIVKNDKMQDADKALEIKSLSRGFVTSAIQGFGNRPYAKEALSDLEVGLGELLKSSGTPSEIADRSRRLMNEFSVKAARAANEAGQPLPKPEDPKQESSTPPVDTIPTVGTKDEYNALPSGSRYRTKSGTVSIKP